MTARLVNADMKEMTVEIPDCSLSKTGRIETERFIIDNKYVDASFQTVRTPLYLLTDMKMRSHEDLTVYSHAEIYGYIRFCAALQGSITSACGLHGEEKWQSGQANLLTYHDEDSYVC
ncbi:MAG: hypothetical protein LBL24_06355, partial [Bacteroidales bacterium]|nr:hypothetical protein [Bacteroidales bacterium]